MMSYLESEENADVSFIVDGKTFKAHSPILQASAPMLVRRQDMTSEVFQIILNHVCTEWYPSDKDILKHIIKN